MKNYRVMMMIDNVIVSSSCLFAGTKKQCITIANRQNRNKDKHSSVFYSVLPCID